MTHLPDDVFAQVMALRRKAAGEDEIPDDELDDLLADAEAVFAAAMGRK